MLRKVLKTGLEKCKTLRDADLRVIEITVFLSIRYQLLAYISINAVIRPNVVRQ